MSYVSVGSTLYDITYGTQEGGGDLFSTDKMKAEREAMVEAAKAKVAAAKAAAQADPSPAKKKALATAREVLDMATQQSTGGGFGVSPVMLIVGAGVAYFLIKGKKGGGRKRRKR